MRSSLAKRGDTDWTVECARLAHAAALPISLYRSVESINRMA
ncbi:hypothetical protein [Streptodolium elevatio]|uniref:Uncharacterized protein n=1 Tax=Streptodolium elevatio TaxID=3157996 RepID=A0ABV3DWS8_9ACTN